jgi:hypothetical protein
LIIKVIRDTLKETIKNPDSTDKGYMLRKIAQKVVDENHVLRVVYQESDSEIKIITLYPARRKRYEKN